MKIMVTGGHGFIGRYVAMRAKERGHETVTFDTAWDLRQDVTDKVAVREFACDTKPDAIIHLAGLLGTHELSDNIREAVDVNIKGAVTVAEVALASDVKMVSIEQPHIWYNPYEATKFAARRILTGMALDQGLKVDFVTAHNAFGPGQAHGAGHPMKILPTFSHNAWRDKPIQIWGDGEQKVNLVWAGDVADVLLDRAQSSSSSPLHEYHAGGPRLYTVNEVARMVLGYVNPGAAGWESIEYLPMRRGENTDTEYPEPDGRYRGDWSIQQLYDTIESYR